MLKFMGEGTSPQLDPRIAVILKQLLGDLDLGGQVDAGVLAGHEDGRTGVHMPHCVTEIRRSGRSYGISHPATCSASRPYSLATSAQPARDSVVNNPHADRLCPQAASLIAGTVFDVFRLRPDGQAMRQ